MQSEPTEVDQSTSRKISPKTSVSSHHGLPDLLEPASRSPLPEEREELPFLAPPPDSSGPIIQRSSSDDEERPAGLPRVNNDETPSSSLLSDVPRGRPTDAAIIGQNIADAVTQHENAPSLLRRRSSDGPVFHVVGRPIGRVHTLSSAIANFPNEVWTHILSHLPPPSLSAIALVSHKFHSLVTTPHAWRVAFSRFFPGSVASDKSMPSGLFSAYDSEDLRSEKRVFTRLTALASWRSEYILRTRLLRSLARGRPAQLSTGQGTTSSPRHGTHRGGSPVVTYNSQLASTVTHLHAVYGPGSGKKGLRYAHGTDEGGSASGSDPNTGKVDNWGISDPQSFLQFAERFPEVEQWGLGSSELVGVPNVMDLSQPCGLVYGEGSPGGLVYYRAADEHRGRFLAFSIQASALELGIPRIPGTSESVCSIWIAKSNRVPNMTEGLIGVMSGSSSGVLTAYSMGTDGLRDHRIGRGETTARWVLSPGVPIIAIAVDDSYSLERRARNRIWAVALNALGEVYYLIDVPRRRPAERQLKLDEKALDRLAWETGRSVHWSLVETTRRKAHPDPYGESDVDASYTPRSSWDGMGLGKDQIVAETTEIETYVKYRPSHFRKVCEGWDMRRKMEIDFAGDDACGGGESIVLFGCGLDEGVPAQIRRYTRWRRAQEKDGLGLRTGETSPNPRASSPEAPLPGRVSSPGRSIVSEGGRVSSRSPSSRSRGSVAYTEEWRTTDLRFGAFKGIQIKASAIDLSTFALTATFEDPLLSLSGASQTSSPVATPLHHFASPQTAAEIPGQRSRFVAAGTNTGVILVWNIRGASAIASELVNGLEPVRVIHTDSPQISSLALTALYLVHGGNDGLVQAWDILASETDPIRTLNSRFTLRARRRLVQAGVSPPDAGLDWYAAGAISLDPDPTVLRGMASLGTRLRYWSYSSSAADEYAGRKRRLRRSQRSSNNGGGAGDGFSGTSRGALKDYIVNEKLELEREKKEKRRQAARLAGRFGVGLLGQGASEEEELAYARMLSEEAFLAEEEKRRSESESGGGSAVEWSSETVTPEGSAVGVASPARAGVAHESLDDDVAEAIRLSLLPSAGGGPTPVEATGSARSTSFTGIAAGALSASVLPTSSAADDLDTDLDFALKLSLAEERSRRVAEGEQGDDVRSGSESVGGIAEEDEFPPLEKSVSPKGKGKKRA